MNPNQPHRKSRKSTRLEGYDYSNPGAYFVTLVTANRTCLFGEVINGAVRLSKFGSLAKLEWEKLPARFAHICLGEYAIMPNHLHAVVWIQPPNHEKSVLGRGEAKTDRPTHQPADSLARSSLGVVVGAYKATTTRLIRHLSNGQVNPVWQRNYHDRILRNDGELRAVSEYILANPFCWDADPDR